MNPIRRLPALAGFTMWMVYEVSRGALMVARDIIAPSPRLSPAIVIVPLECRTPRQTAVLASLISLTPGTLTVGVDPAGGELWVHGLYGSDPDRLRGDVQRLQSRLLAAIGGSA